MRLLVPRPRLALALMLVAIVVAGCATEAAPTPTSPSSGTPTAPAQPSPAPTASPRPTEPAAVAWESATVPASANASSIVQVVERDERLIAIGFDGAFGSLLWTSDDRGRTWTDATPGGFESIGLTSVVEFDGMLVGVGRGNTIDVETQEAAVYLSEDGLEWRKVATTDQMTGQMIDVVAADDALYAVGGVPGEDSAGIWRSTDGEAWRRTGGDIEHAFLWAVAEGGPGLVAVGWRRNPDPDLAVWTSTDGAEWTLAPDPEGHEGFEATDVLALDDGGLVMVGSAFDGSGGRVWRSADGIEWELADVAGGMDGAYARTLTGTTAGVVAVGGGADMAGRVWRTLDGATWEPFGDPVPGAFFQSAYAHDGGLVVSGGTQAGRMATGIEAYAQVWLATTD